MTKPELSAYVASLGMPFMAPDYANGLILELIDRRESVSRSSSSSDASPVAFTADLGAYQSAFVRAVLIPSDDEFERAFERAFAAPEPIVSSSPSTSGASVVPPAAPKSLLSQFMARRVQAPPPKKFKGETSISPSSPGAAPPRPHLIDIRGTAESHAPVTLDISPISGSAWSSSPPTALPFLPSAGFSPLAGNLSGAQVVNSTTFACSLYSFSIGSFELHRLHGLSSFVWSSAACHG